ncbi:pyridoxal-phosphate-dependent aminotransferase family protein [Rubrobacter aplysinae]|uniref:pyridoxal-phosphate-dependent aminotransferase family protein n=1 Tax=Rubrobacter aplysinae TaxID=909625 RepID=UPI00064BAC27|nr:alanine--glyoxylate aminotransferase family protein [Rubrobacter aplysinae]
MMNKYRLMSPGPTPIPPEVSAAGALPIIHHRTPEFGEVFTRVNENLKKVFLTGNDIFTYPASGTGAFEGALVNLFSPGDKVLVVNNGNFGNRWVKMSRAFGLEVTELKYEWGEKADNEDVRRALAGDPGIKAAMCVLSETSTGTVNDIEGFAAATSDTLTVVDAVSGLGACELRTDEWGVDVVVAGSQKALMTPPGLGFVSVSEKAWEYHAESTMPRFYFDFTAAKQAYDKSPPQTAFTPAVSLIMQLDYALGQILEEGVENVFERHRMLGRAAREGIKGMGLTLFGPDEELNTAVTAAWVPEGLDGKALVRSIFEDHGVQIQGGQAEYAGRILRVGHCGYFDAYDIISTMAATELALEAQGHPVELGKGVGAAQRVFSESGVTA